MGHPPAEEALSSLFIQLLPDSFAVTLSWFTDLCSRKKKKKKKSNWGGNFLTNLPILSDPAARKAITLVNHKASISWEKVKTEKSFPIQPDWSRQEADTIHPSMDLGAVRFS